MDVTIQKNIRKNSFQENVKTYSMRRKKQNKRALKQRGDREDIENNFSSINTANVITGP